MYIQFFCPRWGSESLPWGEFCRKVKGAGYEGIEYGIACTTTVIEVEKVWNEAAKNALTIIAQHYDTIDHDFSRHYDNYCAWLEKVAPYPVVKINSQTGKDYFSFDENRKLIEAAAKFDKTVVHETHRNKFSFAAHATFEYLDKLPGLRITLDASHWVCVAESYLDDQARAMELAIERTDHIHARVGYPEGPQVPDPRVKEWEEAVHKHLAWWDKVIELKRAQNAPITITPEFGPFPYMVHDPATGRPICDQWEVNVHVMDILRHRYE